MRVGIKQFQFLFHRMSLLPLHDHREDRYHPPVSCRLVNSLQTRIVPESGIIGAQLEQLTEEVSESLLPRIPQESSQKRSSGQELSGCTVTGPKGSGQ
jgi:hypothetical protein